MFNYLVVIVHGTGEHGDALTSEVTVKCNNIKKIFDKYPIEEILMIVDLDYTASMRHVLEDYESG